MKVIESTNQFVVIDDLLSRPSFESLWSYVQQEDYVSVFSEISGFLAASRTPGSRENRSFGAINKSNKVWRLSDGAPLRGRSIHYEIPGNSGLSYPTNTVIDSLIDALIATADQFARCIGVQNIDWKGFNVLPTIYHTGTALSWHADGRDRTGAFIFYAHPEWNIQWGGELLIADVSPFRVSDAYSEVNNNPWLDNTLENVILLERGIGTFIQPKPNRLVILGTGVHHAIAHVRPAAGDRVRCTMSGFFSRMH